MQLCQVSWPWWPRYRGDMRCSRGQGGRSGGCIEVAAPWPYVSRGGWGAIQLLAACVHSLTWNQSPAMTKGLHQAPPHRASRHKKSPNHVPLIVPPLRTWHTALVYHLSPLEQSKHFVIFTEQREGSWKKAKMLLTLTSQSGNTTVWWSGNHLGKSQEKSALSFLKNLF